MINLTTFNSVETNSKIPISPYNDNTFDFFTQLYPLDTIHKVFEKYFVLSTPIQSSKSIPKTKRVLKDLQIDYYNNYIVLDFDKVYSFDDVNYIIEFFKNNNYRINLFKSKSYNTVYKNNLIFNVKAILVLDIRLLLIDDLTITEIKEAIINYFNDVLRMYCEVDTAAAVINSHQAPTNNEGCLLFNNGVEFYIPNIKDYSITKPNVSITFDKDTTGWFYNHLCDNYQATFKVSSNPSIMNVHLPIEVKSKFGYFWSKEAPYILQHPQKSKNINMFSDFIKSAEGKEYIKEKHNKAFKEAFNTNKGYSFEARYFKINNDIDDIILDFIINKELLVVKGIMGSGKSEIIKSFLNVQTSRVLLISMRRSLAMDMSQKYNIKNYMDDLNSNNKNQYKVGDSLVIQVDSIYKINPDNFDYVIIDEFESLCLYIDNNLKNSNQYIKSIKNLQSTFNKKIIILDAFINNLSIDLHFKNKSINYITNTYKDRVQVFIYEHKQTFITFLEQFTINKLTDEFVTCSFGTLAELKSVERLLQDHGLRVISVTSDTTEDSKKVIYKLFEEKHHNKYDVVLFSPTITVGVSILNNVKHHFHYDSGKSIDPISSIQMLKRSRTVDNIHVYIKGKQTYFKSYSPEYLNEITLLNVKEYMNDIKNIIFYNVDTDTLSNIGKFVNTFTAHNNFFSNGHENTFKFLLTQQFNNIREVSEDIPHHKFEQYQKLIASESKRLLLYKDIKYSKDLISYDTSELDYLRNKKRDDIEEIQLLFLEVKYMFPKLNNNNIVFDISKEYNLDKSYIDKLNAFMIFITKLDKIDNIINEYAMSNISKLFSNANKDDYIKLLRYMNYIKDIRLQDTYSINELKKLNILYTKDNLNFSWFLNKIGYKRSDGNMKILPNYKKFINNILNSNI